MSRALTIAATALFALAVVLLIYGFFFFFFWPLSSFPPPPPPPRPCPCPPPEITIQLQPLRYANHKACRLVIRGSHLPGHGGNQLSPYMARSLENSDIQRIFGAYNAFTMSNADDTKSFVQEAEKLIDLSDSD
ncbi:hypothetical protein BDW59DRAFT_157520 [Aspergillus cavernicola]|uniref:EthD domain-containing protein n=1 Tax=Aspergillus cavernicola TaxID=176166 RepID=A0ABR4IWA9_9EURO